ncbi:hypothetical protein DCAR_0208896 [Daucus carota subsp. sativus]|uniref:Uncharacterized protein n=1 Tax=Daucus carota subsp. sativus TaxID=79200 RepID=A0AAF0WJS6_DAUCS|nr:hypothetical protein DCAR_0208896 [Daucus carota subsp. sativus]
MLLLGFHRLYMCTLLPTILCKLPVKGQCLCYTHLKYNFIIFI